MTTRPICPDCGVRHLEPEPQDDQPLGQVDSEGSGRMTKGPLYAGMHYAGGPAGLTRDEEGAQMSSAFDMAMLGDEEDKDWREHASIVRHLKKRHRLTDPEHEADFQGYGNNLKGVRELHAIAHDDPDCEDDSNHAERDR